VLAVKGGSGSYNVSGGASAGSWAITGIAVASHAHTLGSHYHDLEHGGNPTGGSWVASAAIGADNDTDGVMSAGTTGTGDGYVGSIKPKTEASTGNTGSATSTATGNALWRPAAAVGTLQYPDLS
jgi:hypothetical protein